MGNTVVLPSHVPVMPLPGALLFPHALLPLHIFEPRYRSMLAHALKEERMFSVALVRPARGEWRSADDFHEIASIGLIRACVERSDGTSNLILQGLRRVRFVAFEQVHPFPLAEIEPLESEENNALQIVALGAKLLEIYRGLKENGREFPEKVDRYLSDLGDPEMLADLMAATFISDASRRQEVLEQLSVDARLRLVIRYLREENGSAAA